MSTTRTHGVKSHPSVPGRIRRDSGPIRCGSPRHRAIGPFSQPLNTRDFYLRLIVYVWVAGIRRMRKALKRMNDMNDMDADSTLLSVVLPCFNEEAVIREPHRRLVATLEAVPGLDFELVYIDDGSRDATLNLLRDLQQADARVRVLALSRNFGHQMAVTAGLQHVAGQVVVVIDADSQDPPEVIPEMLARWREGADVAYGVRTGRDGETRFRRWTASVFYRLLARLADIPTPLDTGDFRLMDRTVVDAVLAMPERDRFVRGMVAWTGFRQEPIPYRRAARTAGESNYPFGKLLRLAIDGIVSFSFVPLRLATWLWHSCRGLALAGIVLALQRPETAGRQA